MSQFEEFEQSQLKMMIFTMIQFYQSASTIVFLQDRKLNNQHTYLSSIYSKQEYCFESHLLLIKIFMKRRNDFDSAIMEIDVSFLRTYKYDLCFLLNSLSDDALQFILILLLLIMKDILADYSSEALKTFCGTAMVKFATGIIGIWGTINLYYLSYLKNTGSEINSKTNSFLLLCVILPTSIFVLIAARFSKYLGYKLVIRCCALLFWISPLVLNIKLNLFTLAFFFLLVPMTCFALSSIPILNCLWSQFPKDLNKVSGSAILFFSLGMITWNIIFFVIVNPDNKPAEIDEFKQAYFSKQISDRVITATNWIFGIAGSFFVMGSYLVQRKESPKIIQETQIKQIAQIQQFDTITVRLQKDEQPDKSLEKPITSKSKEKTNLFNVLTEKKFVILFLIAYLVPLYLVYLVMFMKMIFMPIINDDKFLAICSIILTVSAIFGAPIWGLIADRLGFKKTLFIVCTIDLFCKIFGLFCNQKWSIASMYFLIGFTDKGVITIIGPGLIEIFGLDVATQLIPYKGFSMILAHLTIPLFQMIFGSILSYKRILSIFIMLTLISVVLSFYFWRFINYKKFSEQTQSEQNSDESLKTENNSQITHQIQAKVIINENVARS